LVFLFGSLRDVLHVHCLCLAHTHAGVSSHFCWHVSLRPRILGSECASGVTRVTHPTLTLCVSPPAALHYSGCGPLWLHAASSLTQPIAQAHRRSRTANRRSRVLKRRPWCPSLTALTRHHSRLPTSFHTSRRFDHRYAHRSSDARAESAQCPRRCARRWHPWPLPPWSGACRVL